ncbi:DUF397 domain-containing protein [Streptomyces sp. NPDC014861]|uniref:DUF397 domain-containing protein n=1 Tax=Streptomyces sp. NPDC014861 TaxID=3364923 RepID=UPI0036FAAFC1
MTHRSSLGDGSDPVWFKSSHSSSSEGDSCVEVATAPAAVRVRDSKDIGLPQLVLSPAAWAGFVGFARGDG